MKLLIVFILANLFLAPMAYLTMAFVCGSWTFYKDRLYSAHNHEERLFMVCCYFAVMIVFMLVIGLSIE